jgi:nucleoside-diphosphate-sugar epimerase
MKVLVTGATGFIGNYVVEELLRRGFQVIASSSNPGNAKLASWAGRVTYIPLDLQALQPTTDYFDYFQRPDRMIHLAWEGLPNYKKDFHIEFNLPRHLFFLSNLVEHGLEDLTVTGTCFEYGMQEGALKEDMPVFPANPYARAKYELMLGLQELRSVHPFALKWVRLFYMYGKGQNPNSLLSQLDNALDAGETVFNMSGGEQTRDYLPVEKVAAYIVTISDQDKVTGVINCCSGKPVTIKDFVLEYLSKKERKIELNLGYYPYPDYEPMHFWGDTTKLKSILATS